MTELILIRHGETDWNRELRFQGQIDVPLNATGHEQARRVGELLAAEKVHSIICSDLLRTRQTAAVPASRLAKVAVSDVTLREQNFGVVDGMRSDDIQTRHPQAWERWTRFDADFAFDGGESTRQFHGRVLAAIRRIVSARRGERLVVVTHGGVLDMVYRTALGIPLSGARQSVIPNGGISRVRASDTGVEILSWAEIAHLAGMAAQPVYDQSKLSDCQTCTASKPSFE